MNERDDKSCNLIQVASCKPLLAVMRVIENGTIRMHCVSVNCFSKLLASVGNSRFISHWHRSTREGSTGVLFRFVHKNTPKRILSASFEVFCPELHHV